MAKNNGLTAVGILLVIGLLGLNAYQYFVNDDLSKELSAQKESLYKLEQVQTELDQDYQTALGNLEQMRGDNAALNDLIEKQKVELKNQKNKMSGLIWTKGELDKAREEISLMNSQAVGYVNQIKSLTSKNQVLTAAKIKLEEDKVVLQSELEQTKVAVEELDEQKTQLVSLKEELSDENTKLSSKVNMAEAIKINYISVEGLMLRDGKEAKVQSKAKKVDVLKTCIKTETNLVAPSGSKEFQIRIIDPSGATLANDNAGSGVIREILSDKDVRYSFSGDVDYQNKDTDACFEWDPGVDFAQGNYQVEVYNNSFIVGKGEFRLK